MDSVIIIKGGSVHLEFDHTTFQGGEGKHSHHEKKIVGVEIIDDNTGEVQRFTAPANGKCTIRITTR